MDPGQQYEVCGFVAENDYGSPFPTAESQPVLVTLPPTACPPGTEHALNMTAPRSVPIGLQKVVDVQPNEDSLQTVSSASLQMQGTSASKPFFSYAFTTGDLNQLSDYGDVGFYIQFARGNGPARITLTYVQTVSDGSEQQCIDQRTAIVKPAPPITPQVSIYSGASPALALRRKPARIVYSGDGGAILAGFGSTFGHLRWGSWNTSQARARGEDWHDNCIPDCAEGRYSGYPVSIRLWRPRQVDDHLVFTRMTVTYTAARPPYPAYQHRALTYQLHYDSTYNTFYWT